MRAEPRERLRTGERLEIAEVEASLALGLPVVHDAGGVLVLRKPAGLAVHRGPKLETSVAELLERWAPGAGLAHRIDRGASGLLLAGRDAETMRRLARATESGELRRAYLAVVTGDLAGDVTIDVGLRVLDEPMGNSPKVVPDEAGLPSITHVRVVRRHGDRTTIEAKLETGRTHQIRAHLRAIGHPLLGDPRYGDADVNRRARETFGVARPLLHSWTLAWSELALEASLEPDLARMA
ncbi:MAG TPA: RNA pseudouridine synthase [Planctomycetota bacterium]|nr:RNA pseudouridine synthase [Planctomycetota bacterium]